MSYVYCEPHLVILFVLWHIVLSRWKEKPWVLSAKGIHYSNKPCKCHLPPPPFSALYSGPLCSCSQRQRSHLLAVIWTPRVTVPAHLPVTTNQVMKLPTPAVKAASVVPSSFSWALQTQGLTSASSGPALAGTPTILVFSFEDEASQPVNLSNPPRALFLNKNDLKRNRKKNHS